MQEIFNVVLDREEKADQIIKEAEARAREIEAEAEKYYNDKIKEAREKSRIRLAEGSEEIRIGQEERTAKAIADYEEEWKILQEKGKTKIADLADRLARMTARL